MTQLLEARPFDLGPGAQTAVPFDRGTPFSLTPDQGMDDIRLRSLPAGGGGNGGMREVPLAGNVPEGAVNIPGKPVKRTAKLGGASAAGRGFAVRMRVKPCEYKGQQASMKFGICGLNTIGAFCNKNIQCRFLISGSNEWKGCIRR